MSVQAPIKFVTDNLVFCLDTNNIKSYVGEPTTNIWSVQAGTSINSYNGWGMPNAGTASITSAITNSYGTWNNSTIWLVTVGSGTLASYGSWRLCVDQPTAGSAYPSTRRMAAKIRMLTGSITNIGLHSGGGTGSYSSGDFSNISEGSVPVDCVLKDGWVQMLSDASWSSTTVGHCVGIGLNGSGPYSFLVTEPMYYPSNRLINYTPTSRSNTQGLLDLTRNYNIDLTNAGYNSNSQITFNGSSNYISVGSLALPTTAYTKTAWFYPTSFSPSNNIVGGNNEQHTLWLAGGNKLNAGHNGSWSTVVSNTTLSLNTWYFGAVTFDTTNGWKLYLNGIQEATSASTTTFTGTGNINIGAYYASNLFQGNINMVAIYNRVLTASEILQNYNSTRSRFGL